MPELDLSISESWLSNNHRLSSEGLFLESIMCDNFIPPEDEEEIEKREQQKELAMEDRHESQND